MSQMTEETTRNLRTASTGFDALFANDLDKARATFGTKESPFHLLGAGACAFLEAALGMEAGLMAQATQMLSEADYGSKAQSKAAKNGPSSTRYPAGTEWELVHADAVILHALTLALSETYMGYVQCFYELTSANSKFSKLYKVVFPAGIDNYATPATSEVNTPSPSIHSDTSSTHTAKPSQSLSGSGFFSLGRLGGSLLGGSPKPLANPVVSSPEGPIEELIMSGTAFGYGLFNLVFSLLPASARSVSGLLGFKHDRKLALQALAVSATQTDVHAVFAALVLMTYYGVVLLMCGYQANEQHILKQYRVMIDHVESRYPTGSLWILNRAKLLRMSYDAEGAIKVMQDGLQGERPQSFQQADGLIVFELGWTLLSQRRYKEAAEMFMKLTEVNSWSHGTYYFIAAGCYVSIGDYEKAQKLYDSIPALLDKKKIAGKDLPTEVLIKKKVAFYREKQLRKTGSEANFVQAMKISPAEELAIFWNTHTRISKDVAVSHINDLYALSPSITIKSSLVEVQAIQKDTPDSPDLDTPDELAVRSLLLGIVHRTAGDYAASRQFLADAHARQKNVKISTWIGGVACFEMAVLELKETEATVGSGLEGLPMDEDKKASWRKALKLASDRLDQAMSLSPQSVDLSSRLESRVTMLRDEIAMKREMIEKV